MELFITVVLLAILAETTYLVYKTSRANKTQSNNDIVLDTSALIDGRILEIVRSGVVSSRLVIPRSVVRELQFMADKADHDKRERARYGLDVIEKLQQLPDSNVDITDDGTVSEHGVDEQLILLAQRSGAKLCTVDYNLNKAARVQSVEIVNINELAHALRVVHLPGENQDILLVQTGQDKKQAVGYLDDGTMVVVDDAREFIGQSVNVSFTRVLQTAAGRMMFARRTDASPSKPRGRTEPPAKSHLDKKLSSNSPRRKQLRRRPTSPEEKMVDLANE
ncbi:MAG: hypothetical protein ABIR46_01655 [Candidatus Saccharimonadales bacterium]